MDLWNMRNFRLLSTLFLFLMALPLCAQQKQKFHVVGFAENAFDMSARENPTSRDDGTGVLYAIIKVRSTNPDDDLKAYDLDFDYLKDVQEVHDGVLWVYVQNGAKTVTISREGYHTIARYDLKTTLRPGRVYDLELNPEAKRVYKQPVWFKVTPADANATIMYRPNTPDAREEVFGVTDASGERAKTLPYGTYYYRVLSEDYLESEGIMQLSSSETHIEQVTLRPKFSTVTLQAADGCDIYIDGELVATGSWSGRLNEGNYNVECRKAGHKPSLNTITVELGEDKVYTLASPVPIVGSLFVNSTPLQATISIDGKECGQTPRSIDSLLVGSHTVAVFKDGYKPVVRTVEIKENEFLELEIGELERDASFKATPVKKDSADDVKKEPEKKPVVKAKPSKKESVPLFKRNSGYVTALFRFPSSMWAGINAGGYFYGFNVECAMLWSVQKAAFTLNTPSASIDKKGGASLYGIKLGYGIKAGNRLRFTPQLGLSSLLFSSKRGLRHEDVSSGAVWLGTGVKCDFAFGKHWGLTLTPEYNYAVSQGDILRELSGFSPVAKSWGGGFNVDLGLYFSF